MTECRRGVSLVESGHKEAKPHGLVGCLADLCISLNGHKGLPVSSRYRPIGRDRRGLLLAR